VSYNLFDSERWSTIIDLATHFPFSDFDSILLTFEALTTPNPFFKVHKRGENHQTPRLSNDPLVSVIKELKNVVASHNVLRQRDLICELTGRRAVFKRDLLFRDAIILQVSVLVFICLPPSECSKQIISPCRQIQNSDGKIKKHISVDGVVGL